MLKAPFLVGTLSVDHIVYCDKFGCGYWFFTQLCMFFTIDFAVVFIFGLFFFIFSWFVNFLLLLLLVGFGFAFASIERNANLKEWLTASGNK